MSKRGNIDAGLIYCCGPMTPREGEPNDHTYAHFFQAESQLWDAGYAVLNPATNYHFARDEQSGCVVRQWDHSYEPHAPQQWAEFFGSPRYREEYLRVMKRDMRWLTEEATGVALLEGWECSKGALFEKTIAEFFGLHVHPLDWWLKGTRAEPLESLKSPTASYRNTRASAHETQEDTPVMRYVGQPDFAPQVGRFAGDAGIDLYVSKDTTIHPGHGVDVPLGVRCELPDGHWGLLTGRSSTLRNLGLHVANGVIDGGYRGELFAYAQNLNGSSVTVREGQRIAQLILFPVVRPVIVRSNALTSSDRGDGGFGSTGA